eukprot:1156061-Pelagomonas_calceolata.AAC.1
MEVVRSSFEVLPGRMNANIVVLLDHACQPERLFTQNMGSNAPVAMAFPGAIQDLPGVIPFLMHSALIHSFPSDFEACSSRGSRVSVLQHLLNGYFLHNSPLGTPFLLFLIGADQGEVAHMERTRHLLKKIARFWIPDPPISPPLASSFVQGELTGVKRTCTSHED